MMKEGSGELWQAYKLLSLTDLGSNTYEYLPNRNA